MAPLRKILLILYCILKMTRGQTVLGPDSELINARSFDFAKCKLFFKHIRHYAATSTYIHLQIHLNFICIFKNKEQITLVYLQLEAEHKEPFKAITNSLTEVSLMMIESSLEDFHDIIKALT